MTQEEIDAIEKLRKTRSVFIYGAALSTETFVDKDGEIQGFTEEFTSWLSQLFGIKFVPKVYEWEDLIRALGTHEVDFTGELTPNPERLLTYYMTSTIAQRSIQFFRIAGQDSLANIGKERTLKYGFLEGVLTIDKVRSSSKLPFEVVTVKDYEEAYQLLKNRTIDAFFEESSAQAAFDMLDDVVSQDFLPIIYSEVSLATQNKENEVIINIIQKALDAKFLYHLVQFYNSSDDAYQRHKFTLKLTDDERRFLEHRLATQEPIVFGAEYDNYPISFYNDEENEFQGISLDVIEEISKITGLRFKLYNDQPMEWPLLVDALEAGECSFVSELIPSDERVGRFIWSDPPYSQDKYALISKVETEDKEINEILYSRVGLVVTTAWTEMFYNWFPNHPDVLYYNSADEAFQGLTKGEVELLMGTRNLNLAMTNYLEQPGFKVNLIFNSFFESSFGFNKNETMMRSIISKAIPIVDTTNISDRWLQKTFDYRSTLARSRVPWLFGLSIALVLLLVLSLILIYRHKNQSLILESIVKERTSELEAQKDKATLASQAKGDFLARMSHEIRTPMHAIIGMAELSLRENIPDEASEMVVNILNAGNSLLAIINDILDFSKIESGKMELVNSPYHLASLINDVVSVISPRARAAGLDFLLELESTLPAALYGDEVRLRQIILNLLSNGVKYTKSGQVHLKIVSKGGSRVKRINLLVSIQDTGQGIKAEDQAKLFGDFHQVDAAQNRGIEGTGLGLAISRSLAQLMEGDILLESEYGVGSTFTASVFQEVHGDYQPFVSINNPLEARILVLEPDPKRATSLRWTLDDMGLPFTMVSDIKDLSVFLLSEKFSYLFAPEKTYDKIMPLLRNRKTTLKPIFFLDLGQRPKKIPSVRLVSRPVSALTIANILNDTQDIKAVREKGDKVGIIAPEAKALVVDDLQINLKVAQGLLKPFQLQVDVCDSGQEALRLVSENQYDIIFMDHMMPGMDGVETTEKLRETPIGKSIPIIALTANAMSGVKEMFLSHGMNDFISKPIEPLKLENMLAQYLPKSKLITVTQNPEAPYPSTPIEEDISGAMTREHEEEERAERNELFFDRDGGFDLAASLEQLGGDRTLLDEVLDLYVQSTPALLDQLRRLSTKGAEALPEYAKVAHSIKGSSLNVGARKVGEMAAQMEKAAKEGKFETIRSNNQSFIETVDNLLSQMSTHLSSDKSGVSA
ncbi:MAG: transporter substrate-binding domain-containing protein [Deltaproteobacteria bacterium]|nr:transporter substrate-binding domain-containing protein [Deltaproteobacteria bacterium]